MSYNYKYPRPCVTCDAAILRTPSLEYPEILLIKRGKTPFAGKWALPGGFMEMEESPLECATRELQEETGLYDLPLKPLFSCGELNRDPRARTITFVFGCLIRDTAHTPIGSDDAADAKWFSLKDLPLLAFDHKRIISQIEQSIIWQAKNSLIGQDIFHNLASTKEIQKLYKTFFQDEEDTYIERAIKNGYLEKKDGICEYINIVPVGPDWHPMPW